MPLYRFRAPLYRIGANYCVDVPPHVSAALGGAVRIGVRGSLDGAPVRSTLVPRGGGAHRLFVPPTVWRDGGLRVGDEISARIERDPSAGERPALPAFFASALARRPAARAVFNAMRPASQRAVVRWHLAPRTAATRERRLEVGLDRLEARGRHG
jgi:hypothetical protein